MWIVHNLIKFLPLRFALRLRPTYIGVIQLLDRKLVPITQWKSLYLLMIPKIGMELRATAVLKMVYWN